MKKYTVAVVGAFGAVGRTMLKILEARSFPVKAIKPLDKAENTGKFISFAGQDVPVEEAKPGAFSGVDIVLFAAGAKPSEILAPVAVNEGCVVIDNSSRWRMDDGVPLVVPEINPQALREHKGLIANPNCSTVQMLLALKPIHDLYRIKRIIVSTYQAASGTGQKAIDELDNQLRQYYEGRPITHSVYPAQLLLNVIPQIDAFTDNGYTKEEMKMVNETHKILDPDIRVSPTAVRVPVYYGHSEAISVETENPVKLNEAIDAIANQPGVRLMNDWKTGEFPDALTAAHKNEVLVGRIRLDYSVKNGLNLWVAADNLLKGAALNAVQIAEKMIEMELI